ncbi:hypothetical protein [Flavivirga spongiicola]|uniref:DNA replication protein DnaC n=1 Tax=Flavivirga spongiicola TaxID=421621 RepID=A0ABU7XU87_9FLAO|nr:hypothetical protein [Flavivirga sp. MEBiC05379]MDO5978994.1 hypothetical protein [Flavivirga sp. MEBiC05379]
MENLNSNTNESNNIFNQIKISLKNISLEKKRDHPFNKDILWKLFLTEFHNLQGKPFLYDDIIAKNIEPIFHYFLESDTFFNCENLRSDISAPSFRKGLLLFGNVGVGKTHIMEVFELIFKKYRPHRFKIIPTYKVVEKYEDIETSEDRKLFYKNFTTGTILFDDLNSEKMANNYGHVNIMKEILIRRSSLDYKTHLTINPLSGLENDINGSLLKLGDHYDQRMADRLYENFNVIQFNGKSMRR